MNKDSLGDRMKSYEKVPQTALMRRTPVIIRLDGKAFHTYTKGFDKPYDEDLHKVRSYTLNYLCNNIQGALFGYSQSDELSIVIKDWDTYKTCAWFDNKIQKLCSVSASMCTAEFNMAGCVLDGERTTGSDKFSSKTALFDARCFNLPVNEVVNYLIWRQQDWERNSVQMLAQSLYSHKELHGLSCKNLVTKIEEDYDIVWGNLDPWKKRGEFWIKSKGMTDCPIFKDDRESLTSILLETYDEQ